MKTNEINLIQAYLQQGVKVYISIGIPMTDVDESNLSRLNKVAWNIKTPWGKTPHGDFNMYNVTTNLVWIMVSGRLLKLFDNLGRLLITQGPVNKYTKPFLLYKVEHFNDIRLGSTSGEGIVINKGIYAEILHLLDGCPTKVKDLCLGDKTFNKPEDYLFEVILVETHPRLYWIIEATRLDHFGFQVTEII